jgi:hypothetical protein
MMVLDRVAWKVGLNASDFVRQRYIGRKRLMNARRCAQCLARYCVCGLADGACKAFSIRRTQILVVVVIYVAEPVGVEREECRHAGRGLEKVFGGRVYQRRQPNPGLANAFGLSVEHEHHLSHLVIPALQRIPTHLSASVHSPRKPPPAFSRVSRPRAAGGQRRPPRASPSTTYTPLAPPSAAAQAYA